MRHLLPIALLVAALVAPPAPVGAQQAPRDAPPQRPDETTIRREVKLVDLIVTVVNRRQKLVTDLQKEDFTVSEDGLQQEIRYFGRQTDLPLRVGMLLDTSNSIRDRMKFEQEAAIDFLYNVIRRKKDQAFLMVFDNEPSIIQEFTDELGALRDVILRQRAGGGTALYDAIYAACKERLGNPPLPTGESPEVRRVLVVISDGDDNLSSHSRGEAIEMAQRGGVVIYAISTSTQWVSAIEETDGRAFFPYRVDDLAQSFLDIGDELRSQYSLAYVPANKSADGKFRRIQIRVNRKGLIVRARKGYFAPRASAEAPKPASRPPGN